MVMAMVMAMAIDGDRDGDVESVPDEGLCETSNAALQTPSKLIPSKITKADEYMT